jgi:hypothetical protein
MQRSVRPIVPGLDVSVASLGACRFDAQHHHHIARCRQLHSALDHLQKARFIPNYVIRRKNPNHRIGVGLFHQKSRQAARRSSIARHRLLDNLPARNSRQLRLNLGRQQLVGNHPNLLRTGDRVQPLHRLLQHRAIPIQRKHLLGSCAAGARPEAGAASSSQNYRAKIYLLRHGNAILPHQAISCLAAIPFLPRSPAISLAIRYFRAKHDYAGIA